MSWIGEVQDLAGSDEPMYYRIMHSLGEILQSLATEISEAIYRDFNWLLRMSGANNHWKIE